MSQPSIEATNASTQHTNNSKIPKTLQHTIAGSAAGLFSKTVLQPMDLIRTRMQVQDGVNSYKGILHAMRSILAKDGVLGLYQGFAPNMLGSGVAWGCYFTVYNVGKSIFREIDGRSSEQYLNPIENFLSAAMAGTTTVFVSNPIWLVKTRLQLQDARVTRPYRGILHAFSRIIREEGILSLYRGTGPALTLVSNGALQFMAYEELRRFALRIFGSEANLGNIQFLAMGALAKVFASTTTYPLQVIRARLYQGSMPGAEAAPKGGLAIIKHVYTTRGWRGFYRGLGPNIAKTAPSSALTFTVYEQILRLLRVEDKVSTKGLD